ncbi:hypothetical protein DMUE_1523 [Dictyocoela muelleri]|nr:hypothetical protein DMUE_1523 [Dictyocoela muelleri]
MHIKKYFEKIRLMDLFFHFCQNIYKSVNINMLNNIYKNNAYFRMDIKMIISFSFLQTGMIEIATMNLISIYLRKNIIVNFDNLEKFKSFYLKDFLNSKD